MKNKYTPEIRFPGFIGEWEQRKLGEISEKVTEKNKNNIYTETLTNSAEFGIINQRDFFDKDISNEKNLDGYYIVGPDDFVYNPRISNLAPVGPINRNKLGRTGVMSPLYYVFRTHDVEKTFLEKYFSSNSWHIFMKLNGDSGARSDRFAIKDTLFREMPIPFPSIEEQTKIGNFFKQLEGTIALYQQELITLKKTKQGFLQKMFPKEGESAPEIRFPGFTEDWEKQKLGDLLEERNEQMPENEEYQLMSFTATEGVTPKSDRYNREFLVKSDNKKYKKTEKGDLIYSSNNLDVGSIGLNNMGNAVISPVYSIFYVKDGITSDFIGMMIQRKEFIKKMLRFRQGVVYGQWRIHETDFLNIGALIPSSPEQRKIGKFFKQLDETISLRQRELDSLKETKKAFLQKMFA
ncbi:restriction endonuclease subunit S [Bacillus sp. AFS029533]|uniref:restriction endonuclease subunit S n=1 Tax=Bacillus sp. AFS029533 TaxID=2033494 RepID=UPI000BFC37B1|nr:restriction endonuclease subunit S [Bacillus sp. AFS029533]PGZ92188.1 type I restriction endonuclease subunit S [Bacillus sp. AFS029533]